VILEQGSTKQLMQNGIHLSILNCILID